MIDRLRKDIQQRLDELLAEADTLRSALAALDTRGAPPSTRPRRNDQRSRPAAARPRSTTPSRARRRTAPGATKTRVLAALSDSTGMTAGDIAAAAGLGRGTVSTTLSKLAKSGEVRKAERGYQLPASGTTAKSAARLPKS